jgi:hypothetical protein
MRAERIRADSRQAATGVKIQNGRSIECEFDHLFLMATGLTIGYAFCGSQEVLEACARRRVRGQLFGMRVENIRADSRQAATGAKIQNGRSIECEFDHLFLVATGLTIGYAFCGSQDVLEACALRRVRGQLCGMRVENIRADSHQAATGPRPRRYSLCFLQFNPARFHVPKLALATVPHHQ